MIIIRARACIKCKVYVIVHPNNPANQELIKTFEDNHIGHNLVTLDLDEVQGTYQDFEATQPEE